ncbi:MAG: AAA domain-containing protein, partial [Clostridium saudiense]|nr:AAA domain-containing protein [Clostridium saudiense]
QISDVFDGDYQEEKSVYNDFKKMYQELMDEKKKRQDYYEDLKKIKDIKSNIIFLKEEKQIEISKFLNEIDELNVKCDTYKSAVIKFEENKKIYLEKITYLNDQVANYNKEYELLQIKKPAFLWLKKMFQTIEAKKYIEEIEIFNNKRNDCLNELSNLNQENSNNEKEKNKYQEKYDFSNSEIEKLKQKINSKEKEYNDKISLLEMKINFLNEKIDPKDIQKLNFEVSNDELQKSNPWFDKKFRILQTKLFISALKVRKQFLYENKKSVKSAQIIWKNREEYASNKDLIVNAWQWINFTIPVISTTFASFGSMFYYMPENSISNLFIDEAGQALPQASVGAIFRSKKIMAVGDPEQIQPVLTLESGILSIIKNEYKVGDKYISPDASTQTLLDEVSPYGYYKDQDHWIGIPLWVHRRSNNPMFTISNRISYNDLMVQGKDKANGKAKWYHVEGTASDKYVKEEAEILKKLIKDKIEKNSKLKDEIFVISPFKNVANELAKELKKFDGIKFTKYDKNKKPINVGTVHTFQGKEAKIVYFVMGADFKSKGAASWAVSKPNIINVAVTRAKEEFYVIGNSKLYKSIGTNAGKMIELIDQYNENK